MAKAIQLKPQVCNMKVILVLALFCSVGLAATDVDFDKCEACQTVFNEIESVVESEALTEDSVIKFMEGVIFKIKQQKLFYYSQLIFSLAMCWLHWQLQLWAQCVSMWSTITSKSSWMRWSTKPLQKRFVPASKSVKHRPKNDSAFLVCNKVATKIYNISQFLQFWTKYIHVKV